MKSRADAILRDDTAWGRTDQFTVAKQLDGLQEKFRIVNKDDFADALRDRLDELDKRRVPWAPEVLSLLLQLSDRPADVPKLPKFDAPAISVSESPLKWSDLDDTGVAYSQEDIWAEVDFGAISSDDDDYSITSSDVSIPRIVPQSNNTQPDVFVVPEEFFSTGDDDELIATIKSGHFWEYDSAAVREFSESHTRYITELQATREILFMLQGLPTSLFWQLDDENIAIDRRYALRHSSNSAFMNILKLCTSIGTRLRSLRKFVTLPQSVVFLQTFVKGVEEHLREFDVTIGNLHLRYLSVTGEAVFVSLLQLMEDIEKASQILLLLYDITTRVKAASSDQAFICLDLLYDLVCVNQAAGNDHAFRALARLFFACFEAYCRPIRLWIEAGDLDASQGEFFISETGRGNDLRTLWHDWYSLEESSGRIHAPKFLKPAVHKILTTGKSIIFLRNLGISPEDLDGARKPLALADVCPDDDSLGLQSFASLLEQSFADSIAANHQLASDLLRQQLNEQCGLWTSLSALEYIYLCRDLSVTSVVDSKVFELLDRDRRLWNDRFLITELVQSTFSEVLEVDPSRLIVRSSNNSSSRHAVDPQNRSVKLLEALYTDYVLPWPVANIITKSAISSYQRISTFLMQIRWAKYVVEQQRLRKPRGDDNVNSSVVSFFDADPAADNVGYAIRHSLLWFTNILYNHMTALVIAPSTAAMEKSLAAARDVDAMIAVHSAYMASLERQLLLSKNLKHVHDAVISMLDLCVHFADVQAARHGEHARFDRRAARSFLSSSKFSRWRGRRPRRSRRREGESTQYIDELDSDDDDDDLDEIPGGGDGDVDDNDEGNTTSVSFVELSYSSHLNRVREEFNRLLGFIVSGLRGVGRVDGLQSWEVLADRLDWKNNPVRF